jgi:hypothetical protein
LTDEGIQIDESDEQSENAESRMLKSLDPGSKVTVERDEHASKQ